MKSYKIEDIINIFSSFKNLSKDLINLSNIEKNRILATIANDLDKNRDNIIIANQKDVENAKKSNLSLPKIDRLILNNDRIDSIINSVKEIILLDDPVGKITYHKKRDNNLDIKRVTCPFGAILAIYESRPNVTSDIAALCFKSSNISILKAGSDSYYSSKIIADIYKRNLQRFDLNDNMITYIGGCDIDIIKKILNMNQYIDIVIPRGGKNLIKFISDNSNIAIFKHLDGNCHIYVDEYADIDKAIDIIINSKLRRTSICGAAESLIIHNKFANDLIPKLLDKLTNEYDCEVRGEEEAVKIDNRIHLANEEDFQTEYLDKIISLKLVNNIEEAIDFININSSSHTESIITENDDNRDKFFKFIDSAIVMCNSSTQFADGYEFGLGSEIGISTGKLHARGPVGLDSLVTYKYIVNSNFALRD